MEVPDAGAVKKMMRVVRMRPIARGKEYRVNLFLRLYENRRTTRRGEVEVLKRVEGDAGVERDDGRAWERGRMGELRGEEYGTVIRAMIGEERLGGVQGGVDMAPGRWSFGVT